MSIYIDPKLSISNVEVINWYDFEVTIEELARSNCKINPIPAGPAYPLPDKTKIKTTPGIQLKYWKQSMAKYIKQLFG